MSNQIENPEIISNPEELKEEFKSAYRNLLNSRAAFKLYVDAIREKNEEVLESFDKNFSDENEEEHRKFINESVTLGEKLKALNINVRELELEIQKEFGIEEEKDTDDGLIWETGSSKETKE